MALRNKFNWPWPESVLNGPAHESPNGVYDFDIVPPYNHQAYALIGICATLTAVGAILRLYAKIWISRKFYVEDCTSCFSGCPCPAPTVLLIEQNINSRPSALCPGKLQGLGS